ncbi:MAG: hypothetical protein ABR860_06950, partial [Terracidiphilus sp.]
DAASATTIAINIAVEPIEKRTFTLPERTRAHHITRGARARLKCLSALHRPQKKLPVAGSFFASL